MIGRARLLFAGILFVALAAGARPAYADGVSFGAKIGPLFPSISKDVTNFKNRTGWLGGVWVGGNRRGAVGIQADFLYGKKNVPSPLVAGGDVDVHFFEIPVMARINLGTSDNAGGYILVGPAFDINLKSELNGLDVKSQYESLDLGIIGGAGFEITRFILEVRYNWGLSNVINGDLTNTTPIKTRTFVILFGVRFTG
jgi:hypothetical protein